MIDLEKIDGNIKWFRYDGLRIKWKDMGEKSEIWATFDGYNICLKLMMFDFVERIKEELLLNISTKRVLNNQTVFIIDSENALELISYILEFVDKWNIRNCINTALVSDFIPDNLWYK